MHDLHTILNGLRAWESLPLRQILLIDLHYINQELVYFHYLFDLSWSESINRSFIWSFAALFLSLVRIMTVVTPNQINSSFFKKKQIFYFSLLCTSLPLHLIPTPTALFSLQPSTMDDTVHNSQPTCAGNDAEPMDYSEERVFFLEKQVSTLQKENESMRASGKNLLKEHNTVLTDMEDSWPTTLYGR